MPWWPRSPDRASGWAAALVPSATSAVHREALQAATELLRGAVAEVAHLDEGLDPGLAGRALGDDEDPDGLDGTVPGLGLALRPTTEGGPGGLDGVEGIGLAGCAGASGDSGRSTSTTSTPTRRR